MICTLCKEDKKLDDFSPQVTNPAKIYAWCDCCRIEQNKIKRQRNKWDQRDYASEIEEMREKGRQLMKIDANEAYEIRVLAELGQNQGAIAQQYSVSPHVISKVINRTGLYAEI